MRVINWSQRDSELLSDTRKWGPGYGGQPLSEEYLNEAADLIATSGRPPGYGPRLFDTTEGYTVTSSGMLMLPSGFDAVDEAMREVQYHSSLIDPARRTSPPWQRRPWQVSGRLQSLHIAQGYTLDQNGRACNPYGPKLVADPRIGLNTNLGGSCFGGETVVVEVIVVAGRYVLFATGDTQTPQLFSDIVRPEDYGVRLLQWQIGMRPVSLDGLQVAARRIIQEQAGIPLPVSAEYDVVWGCRPVGPTETWHAWNLVYTMRVQVAESLVRTLPPEGVRGAWHSIGQIGQIIHQSSPSQQRSIRAAMA